LAGVDDIEAANRWLREVYIGEHNARFAVTSGEDGSAFIAFVGHLDNVLEVKAERVVSNDNAVRLWGACAADPRTKGARATPSKPMGGSTNIQTDASLSFRGPRDLARFEACGARIEETQKSVA
jgi:hypothetical protein